MLCPEVEGSVGKGCLSSLCSEMHWAVEPQRRRAARSGAQGLGALGGL